MQVRVMFTQDIKNAELLNTRSPPVHLLLVAGGGIRSRYLLNMNQESRALAHGATAH